MKIFIAIETTPEHVTQPMPETSLTETNVAVKAFGNHRLTKA